MPEPSWADIKASQQIAEDAANEARAAVKGWPMEFNGEEVMVVGESTQPGQVRVLTLADGRSIAWLNDGAAYEWCVIVDEPELTEEAAQEALDEAEQHEADEEEAAMFGEREADMAAHTAKKDAAAREEYESRPAPRRTGKAKKEE